MNNREFTYLSANMPLSDKTISEVAIHGKYLYNEGRRLYLNEGDVPPPVLSFTDTVAMVHLSAGNDIRERGAFRRLSSRLRQPLAHKALEGTTLRTDYAPIKAGSTPVTFFIARIPWYQRNPNNQLVMKMEPTLKDRQAPLDEWQYHPFPPADKHPEITQRFIDTIMSCEPSSLLYYRQGELSGNETKQACARIFDTFNKVAETHNIKPEAASEKNAKATFKLPDGVGVEMRYNAHGSIYPSHFISVRITTGDESDPYIHMTASQPTIAPQQSTARRKSGPTVQLSYLPFVAASIQPSKKNQNQESQPLVRDDILSIVDVVSRLKDYPGYAMMSTIVDPYAYVTNDIEHQLQPEVPLSDDLSFIRELLNRE